MTQRWVRATGRLVSIDSEPWLRGPIGRTRGIGPDFFEELADREGLVIRQGPALGLLADFDELAAPDFDPTAVNPAVAEFYERTGAFELDSWSQWSGWFRPFGVMLARIFSRRLQQLNVPLDGLDTSRGVSSDVIHLIDPESGSVRYTAWVRHLLATGDVLYAGSYALANVPGRRGACVKVVFPLPNGNAIVLMRPEAHPDGSFSVISAGNRFGDPGFYFTVDAGPGRLFARHVGSLKESIRVYPGEAGQIRADHVLTFWGMTFLKLHYRLRPSVAWTSRASIA
jgi:hypothetical protein